MLHERPRQLRETRGQSPKAGGMNYMDECPPLMRSALTPPCDDQRRVLGDEPCVAARPSGGSWERGACEVLGGQRWTTRQGTWSEPRVCRLMREIEPDRSGSHSG